jgi:hypothetical protein
VICCCRSSKNLPELEFWVLSGVKRGVEIIRVLPVQPNAEDRIRESSSHQLSCSFHVVPGKVLRRESSDGYLRELTTAKVKDIRMSKIGARSFVRELLTWLHSHYYRLFQVKPFDDRYPLHHLYRFALRSERHAYPPVVSMYQRWHLVSHRITGYGML